MSKFENLDNGLFQKFENEELTDLRLFKGGLNSTNSWSHSVSPTEVWNCSGDATDEYDNLIAAWDCERE